MGSLRLSTVVVAAAVVVVVVCLSILLLSPTEVEGVTCDIPYGPCWFWPFFSADANCKENCLKLTDEKYEDGQCRPSMSVIPGFPKCFCCKKEHSRAERESI